MISAADQIGRKTGCSIGPYRKLTNSRCPLQLIDYNGNNMVEAGGVEPPSEKARNEENYVRIRLISFRSPLQNRRERRRPSPIEFRPPAPDRSLLTYPVR